jgi:hypothetical protein
MDFVRRMFAWVSKTSTKPLLFGPLKTSDRQVCNASAPQADGGKPEEPVKQPQPSTSYTRQAPRQPTAAARSLQPPLLQEVDPGVPGGVQASGSPFIEYRMHLDERPPPAPPISCSVHGANCTSLFCHLLQGLGWYQKAMRRDVDGDVAVEFLEEAPQAQTQGMVGGRQVPSRQQQTGRGAGGGGYCLQRTTRRHTRAAGPCDLLVDGGNVMVVPHE